MPASDRPHPLFYPPMFLEPHSTDGVYTGTIPMRIVIVRGLAEMAASGVTVQERIRGVLTTIDASAVLVPPENEESYLNLLNRESILGGPIIETLWVGDRFTSFCIALIDAIIINHGGNLLSVFGDRDPLEFSAQFVSMLVPAVPDDWVPVNIEGSTETIVFALCLLKEHAMLLAAAVVNRPTAVMSYYTVFTSTAETYKQLGVPKLIEMAGIR